jgi:hypothetical protein
LPTGFEDDDEDEDEDEDDSETGETQRPADRLGAKWQIGA